jgi:hypothetical protein
MTRPPALDLFSGVGGVSKGWHDAGFAPYGVDTAPQPRYPYPFHQGDAFDVLDRLDTGRAVPFTHPGGAVEHLTGADLTIRLASPPCTEHSTLAYVADPRRDEPDDTGWMLEETLTRLLPLPRPPHHQRARRPVGQRPPRVRETREPPERRHAGRDRSRTPPHGYPVGRRPRARPSDPPRVRAVDRRAGPRAARGGPECVTVSPRCPGARTQ